MCVCIIRKYHLSSSPKSCRMIFLRRSWYIVGAIAFRICVQINAKLWEALGRQTGLRCCGLGVKSGSPHDEKSTPWIPMATARRFKTQWNIMKHDSDRPSPNAESLHILRKSKILRIAKFAALYLGIPSRPAVQRLTKTFNFSLIQIWFSGIQWWTIRQHKGKVQIDLQTASRTGMDSMAPRWTAFRKTPLIRSRNSWIGVTKHHKYHNKTMQNHTGCARATFVFPVVAYGCLVSCSFSEPAMCSLRHPGVACTTMVDASQENIARKHGDARGKS